MNELIDFLRPELLILVVALWILGRFLKLAPWFPQDWMIPFILLGVSEVLTIVYVAIVAGEGFTAAGVISSMIQGLIVVALAVFGNETIKQLTKGRMEDSA